MFGVARFVRKQAEVDQEVDLEDFLRSALPLNDEERASAREVAPSEPPVELDARLDEALSETFPASDPIAVS